MDITELIEIGLAGTDRDRVEIVDVEPVGIATEGVVGLSAIVSQLVYNATELLSDDTDKVRISGTAEDYGYSLLIIDRGVGMSDEFLEGLNLILANPRGSDDGFGTSGVQLVAGLAARHGIGVRLEHGHPGVTARVSIPLRLLEDRIPSLSEPVDVFPGEPAIEVGMESVPALSRPLDVDTEAFLESVFGPMRDDPTPLVAVKAEPLEPAPEGGAVVTQAAPEPLPGYRRASLRTRIPGRNYNATENDPSHTKAGESAVEIRLALTDYTRGRRAAALPEDDQA